MAPTVLHSKLPLTENCHHYDDIHEVPHDIQKYWHQRYNIFQHYDYDIHLTDDAWFGVTPEPVATRIARDLSPSTPNHTTLIDIFAGAGGNVIAFALSEKWERIIAIEKDASTLACAQHNAEVYGVLDAITWVHGDSFEYLAQAKNDQSNLDEAIRIDPDTTTVFASPPWGGVNYRDHEIFDLSTMEPYNLEHLHKACHPMEHVLFLPRTSDIRQIAKLVPDGVKIDVVQYCMEGASKAMVAYMPTAQI
ncbi:Trimethylguanosine synthase [Podospora aff. communis PSN243]|uniref:Trimethylguanosine synthase n=1 Tax=Podospora aff. communis PSN243 TaxID=3040156 RepID=A0AAV9GGQ2_9PEZI|nr:Trimethylguanosine synthase [Podospora aff. communis PSN243]